MAKANAILQNSILWNLREVTKLAEKIKAHCGDVDCNSWRYPLASCSELEIFKLLQTNRNLDNYTYTLELTYDRLLYLFNLMVKYLESTESLKNFRPSNNVYRPKSLSLASVLHMVWERIKAQVENGAPGDLPRAEEPDETEKLVSLADLSASKSSICTQSEVSSISLCSCCEMVQKFVTHLVLEMEKLFEKQDFVSAITNERKIMRECLVEMTNWSAMTRWLTAILTDITTLSEKLNQLTTNSRKLRHKIETGEKKMKIKIEQQEEDTRRLESRLEEKELSIQEMKQALEKLIEERNRLNELVKQTQSELEKNTSRTEAMKKNYEKKLKDKGTKEEKERKELRQLLDAERRKLEEVQAEKEKLEGEVSRLREELENIKAREEENDSRLLNRLNIMEKTVEVLSLAVEEKEKTIKDYSARIMEAFPELTDAPKPKYAASGNPETDMESQIEANRLRMELLKSENEKLQNTLKKIKSLKG